MQPIARQGDIHVCPLHGTNSIVQVASKSSCDARPIATVGDVTGCGAVIVTGSFAMKVDGKPVALFGSTTSHGGKITLGSAGSKA